MTLSQDGLSAAQSAQLLATLDALRNGDFAARLQFEEASSAIGDEALLAVNALADQIQNFALQASRQVHATCVEGQLGAQIESFEAHGDWQTLTESLNNMSLILATQIRDIGRVAAAVAEGDLSQQVQVAAQGEMAQIKDTFNSMIGQLQLLKDSVTRMMEHVSSLNADPIAAPRTPKSSDNQTA